MNKLTLVLSHSAASSSRLVVFIIQQPINRHILLTERSVKTSHVFTCFSAATSSKMCRVQQLARSWFHQLAAAFGPKPRCGLKSAAVAFDRSDVLQTVRFVDKARASFFFLKRQRPSLWPSLAPAVAGSEVSRHLSLHHHHSAPGASSHPDFL